MKQEFFFKYRKLNIVRAYDYIPWGAYTMVYHAKIYALTSTYLLIWYCVSRLLS